jgi:predicted  nucleic acid-binding Zn-ribbon protein
MRNGSGNRHWQNSATAAAEGSLTERWRRITEQWAGARSQYQALCESAPADVLARYNAARRWHDLAIRRLALAQALEEDAR